ncbi:MAG: glycine oxidase ThiO [Acidobacteria bacterium]|nr:glycine oxidase ThiO [Acidobacteriota bacterium]
MVDCEVVVVGAGVVGGSIAYELASRGVAVTLLDSRGAGRGSTQAAAGMLVPYIEGFENPFLTMASRSLGMYDDFIDRLSRDSGIGIGYRRTGSLQVGVSDESIAALRTVAAGARAAGVRCTFLDAQQTRDAEPALTPEAAGGLLIPEHGFVVPGDLCGALLAAAIKHGARVHAPERVCRIAVGHGRLEVQLERDSVSASTVVLAAGSWSGQIDIAGVPPLPVRPVRGQLLQLASDAPPLRYVTWGPSRGYLVPSGAGSILAGATMEEVGFDERATVAGVRHLLETACDLIPHLRQATFAGTRVGLRPATSDGLPIIGRSRKLPGLVYATGHFRNGVLLAPLTGRVVADLMLENREDEVLGSTSPQRFGEF